MTGRCKFVSMALAVMLFVSQACALSACWIPMPTMQEMAMGETGMIANMQPIVIQRGPASSSCCEISAANSPPVSLTRATEYSATSKTQTSGTSVLDVPGKAVSAEPTKAYLRGSGCSPQASLCVFLI